MDIIKINIFFYNVNFKLTNNFNFFPKRTNFYLYYYIYILLKMMANVGITY